MKKLLFILIIGLAIGCTSEPAPTLEVDIDSTVETRVAKEFDEKKPEPSPTIVAKSPSTIGELYEKLAIEYEIDKYRVKEIIKSFNIGVITKENGVNKYEDEYIDLNKAEKLFKNYASKNNLLSPFPTAIPTPTRNLTTIKNELEPTATPEPEIEIKIVSPTPIPIIKPHLYEFISTEIDNDGALHIQVSNPTSYPFELYFWVMENEGSYFDDKLSTQTSCMSPNKIIRLEVLNSYDMKNKELYLAMTPARCGDTASIFDFKWSENDEWMKISGESKIYPVTELFPNFSKSEIVSLNQIYEKFEIESGIYNWESRKKDLDRNYRSEIFNDIWSNIEMNSFNDVKNKLEGNIGRIYFDLTNRISINLVPQHLLPSWHSYSNDSIENRDILVIEFHNPSNDFLKLKLETALIDPEGYEIRGKPKNPGNYDPWIETYCVPPKSTYNGTGSGVSTLTNMKDYKLKLIDIQVENCGGGKFVPYDRLIDYGIESIIPIGKFREWSGSSVDSPREDIIFTTNSELLSSKIKGVVYQRSPDGKIFHSWHYKIASNTDGERRVKDLDGKKEIKIIDGAACSSHIYIGSGYCDVVFMNDDYSIDDAVFKLPDNNIIIKRGSFVGLNNESNIAPLPDPVTTPEIIPASYSLDKPVSKLTERFSGFTCFSNFDLKLINSGDKEDMEIDIKWYDINGILITSGAEKNPNEVTKTNYFSEKTPEGVLINQYWTLDFGLSDCWPHDEITKDLYGQGVISVNGKELPFVEITVE